MAANARFYEVLRAAVADLMDHGFDSVDRVDLWVQRLREAARHALVPESVLERQLRDALTLTYQRASSPARLLRLYPGVSAYTVERVRPQLRAELDRRIAASAGLIRLNREAAIQQTLHRFAGWATSIPAGGTTAEKRGDVKDEIRRGIAGLPFRERRVIIDQGHKLAASISEIVAVDGGAIAAVWRHAKEGGGYQARPEHEARDGKIFVLRDCWAMRDGLMKPAGAQYTDDVEQPAQEPYCRCTWQWVFNLRDLPEKMLTAKGRKKLEAARSLIRGMRHAAGEG